MLGQIQFIVQQDVLREVRKMTEITFVSNYKKYEWVDLIKFEFEDDDEKAVYALSKIDKLVSDRSYELLGDLKDIDLFLDKLLKEHNQDLVEVLNIIKPKDIKQVLDKFPKEYKPFLEAYILRRLLEKTKTYAWLKDYEIKNKPPQSKAEALEYEGVALFIKHKKYFAVKRMSIIKDTSMEEILQTLVSAYNTIYRKAFDFTNLSYKEVNEKAKSITKGKKKGYQTLAELLKTNRELNSNSYLLNCVLESMKMYPYIDIDSFNKVFPKFKMKKQKKK